MNQEFFHKEIGDCRLNFRDIFLADIKNLDYQDSITLGLSGGRSVVPFYEEMKAIIQNLSQQQQRKFRFVLVDERLTGEKNAETAYSTFLNFLLEENIISGEQIFFPVPYDNILSIQEYGLQCTKDYSLIIHGIDIALFGVGEDGHIGGIFPEIGEIDSRPYKDQSYFPLFRSPKNPPERMSITPEFLSKCKFSYLFFIGKEKQLARQSFYDTSLPAFLLPAKYTQNSFATRIFVQDPCWNEF